MTKEVNIGEQTVKLRATGSLPIAYRLCFNRDMLQDMDQWREKLNKELEASEQATPAPVNTNGVNMEVSEQTNNVPVEASPAEENVPEGTKNQILYSMDLALIARLAFCMAKSADPSIPGSMTEWLDTLESPNALYILTGEVLELYNSGFQTTVDAKKNIPPQLEP